MSSPKEPSATAKTYRGSGSLILKTVPHLSGGTSGVTPGALTTTNKIIGIAVHPGALCMAAWTSFANNEFAGVPTWRRANVLLHGSVDELSVSFRPVV